MTEVAGEPGLYEDQSVDYETPCNGLKETGREGCFNSGNEGQRHDHEWIERLIGESPLAVD
jgi:hypothetical protein